MATCPAGLVCGAAHSIPSADAGEAECSWLPQEPYVSVGAQQGEAMVWVETNTIENDYV